MKQSKTRNTLIFFIFVSLCLSGEIIFHKIQRMGITRHLKLGSAVVVGGDKQTVQ